MLFETQGRHEDVIRLGILALKMFGIRIGSSPGIITLMKAYMLFKLRLGNNKVKELINLPEMVSGNMKTIMHIFMNISAPSFFVNQQLLSIAQLKMSQLSMKYGKTRIHFWAPAFSSAILTNFSRKLSRIISCEIVTDAFMMVARSSASPPVV